MKPILEWAIAEGPMILFQADPESLTLTCVSPSSSRVLGYPPADLLGNSNLWSEHVHPDDRGRARRELLSQGTTECRMQRSNGAHIRVRVGVRARDDENGSPAALSGWILDIGGEESTGEEVTRRDGLLETVNFTAGRLVRSRSWEDSIDEILERTANATGATRAYLCQYVRSGNGIEPDVRHEFTTARPTGSANEDGPPADAARWRETLRSGAAVHGCVGELPERVRDELLARGVQSAAALPVRVDGELWGHLGFEDHSRARQWSRASLEALEGTARMLGGAIARQLSEARYRHLVETIPAAVYLEGLGDSFAPNYEWATDYVSPQVEAVTGYPPDVWAHPQRWPEVIHPEDRDAVVTEDVRSGREELPERPAVTEYRVVKPDGTIGWVHDEARVVRDEDGHPLFWQGFMLDLTAQKRAEQRLREAEAKYRTLVERLPAAVFIEALREERDLYMSPHIEALLGFTPEEWVANRNAWLECLHPGDRDWVRGASETALERGEPFSAEYRMLAKDRRVVWVREETALIRDEEGEPSFWQGVWLDITQQKQAEESLHTALRRERQATERLRAVDEMKSTFLAAISHELRTPLTSVLGYATSLERGTVDLASPEAEDFVRRLAKNAWKLSRLLEDLLDLNRLTRGMLEAHRTPTDVAGLIERVLGDADIRDRAVHEKVEPVVAELDAPKVERIVANLLANALKYTPPGSPIWLVAREWANGVLIMVEDAGPGVPDDQKEAVFAPFQHGQASAAHPHAPGTGVGLALVAQVARMHGGRAWVEDRPGGGASFRVLLPAPGESATQGRAQDRPAS